jgi:hypothetical protein
VEKQYKDQVERKTRLLKKEKEDLLKQYYALRFLILSVSSLEHTKDIHNSFAAIDKEFSKLCKPKYSSYEPLPEYRANLENPHYHMYLVHRANKMVKDIDRILFYFVKQD